MFISEILLDIWRYTDNMVVRMQIKPVSNRVFMLRHKKAPAAYLEAMRIHLPKISEPSILLELYRHSADILLAPEVSNCDFVWQNLPGKVEKIGFEWKPDGLFSNRENTISSNHALIMNPDQKLLFKKNGRFVITGFNGLGCVVTTIFNIFKQGPHCFEIVLPLPAIVFHNGSRFLSEQEKQDVFFHPQKGLFQIIKKHIQKGMFANESFAFLANNLLIGTTSNKPSRVIRCFFDMESATRFISSL